MVVNMLIIQKNYKKKQMQRKKSFRVDIGWTLREVIKNQPLSQLQNVQCCSSLRKAKSLTT